MLKSKISLGLKRGDIGAYQGQAGYQKNIIKRICVHKAHLTILPVGLVTFRAY